MATFSMSYRSTNGAVAAGAAGGAGGAGSAGSAGEEEIPIAPLSFYGNLEVSINELKNLFEAIKLVTPDEQIILFGQIETLKDQLITEALSIAPYAVDVPNSFKSYMDRLELIETESRYLAEKQIELEHLRYVSGIASECSEDSETGAIQAVEALKKLEFPMKEIERVSANLEEYSNDLSHFREIFVTEMVE